MTDHICFPKVKIAPHVANEATSLRTKLFGNVSMINPHVNIPRTGIYSPAQVISSSNQPGRGTLQHTH